MKVRLTATHLGATSLALVMGAVAILTAIAPNKAEPPTIAAAAQLDPVVLLLVRGADGRNTGAAILIGGSSRDESDTFVIPTDSKIDLIPQRLIAEISSRVPTASTHQSISATSGIRIDGTLVLDQLGFAALIDSVGGIRISRRTMDGMSAVRYASFLLREEEESARTARFHEVLDALMSELPTGREELKQIMTLLGLSARSSMPTDEVVTVLQRVSTARAFGNKVSLLPTTAHRMGSSYEVLMDRKEIAATIPSSALRRLGDGLPVRVLVRNESGIPSLDLQVRVKLEKGGFAPVSALGAQSGRVRSVVQVVHPRFIEQASLVATAIGLPGAAVTVVSQMDEGMQVVALIGTDLVPVRE